MIHQPMGGARGQASDIVIQAKEIQDLKNTLNGIYVKHTGLQFDLVERETDRDNYLDPKKALEMGLIDHVIVKKHAK
jgi:ATP-dependent Clp protease protease subunit